MLVAEKLRVAPIVGWEARRAGASFKPTFIVIHHTAATNSLKTIIHGRPDLPGPLSNLHITKDGTVNLVAAGRCNHAGPGSNEVLERMMGGYPPRGTAAEMGYRDGPTGNTYSYGFECENLGDGRDPWPAAQLQAMVAASAAICRWHGWTANRVIGHLEWTRRKIDPRGFPMAAFRSLVSDALKGKAPVPPGGKVMVRNYIGSLVAPNGGTWHLQADGGVISDSDGLDGPVAPFYGSVPGAGGAGDARVRALLPHGAGYKVVVQHPDESITYFHFPAT